MSGSDSVQSDDVRRALHCLGAHPASVFAVPTADERTILDRFRETCARHGDREAVRYFDASITHAEMDSLSDGFAGWLAHQGVGAGDRVGVLLQNVPHMIVANLAAWKLRAIPVPGNPMYRASELAGMFADYRPSAVVCHDDQGQEVGAALRAAGLAATPRVSVEARDFQTADDERFMPPPWTDVRAGDDFLACCARGLETPWSSPSPLREDIAFLLYTSGTTGQPKGAVLTHSTLSFATSIGVDWLTLTAHSRILGLAPLFHITGYVLHMAVTLATGCSLALNYRFHPEGVLDVMRTYRPTYTIAAITAFNALMNTPGAQADDFSSFERVSTGGAPMGPVLQLALRQRLGITVLPAYGMTETCSPALLPPSDVRAVPHDGETGALAVGVAVTSTEVRIAGPDGAALPPGQQGEIWMRGPHIMRGYWNKPAETAEALQDGWLKSGDIGFMDAQGWVYVVDRRKNMINASGFKVWPREV
jgi:long-chain acyl-CoA synthetase